MADPLQAYLRRPFDEQVAAFRLRLGDLIPTTRWDDISGPAHDKGFMVAGTLKADLLADLAAAVDRAISEGRTLDDFRRDFRAIVKKHGWHGWTGEGTEKGENWRTKVILKTNISTSYAAGRWAQLKAKGFKYLVYRHSGAEHPRLDHLSWNGLVLPIDHPFWLTHFPPNGWGCGCSVRGAMSLDLARMLGGNPDKTLPEGWDALDPRTGAPPGIDKGWAHGPGRTVDDLVAALVEKPVHWDFSLATAYMKDVPIPHRDAFSRGYRSLPSAADEMRRYAERVMGERNGAPIAASVKVEPQRTLGLVEEAQRGQIEQVTGVKLGPDLYDYIVDQSAVQHVMARHSNPVIEASRGQRAITVADFARLGEVINSPDLIAQGQHPNTQVPVIRMEKQFGAERVVALFQLRLKRRRLALLSMWVETGASPTITP